METYDEGQVHAFNEDVERCYKEAKRAPDAQYTVWVARTVWDVARGGLTWDESRAKHRAELREALGLDAAPPAPVPAPSVFPGVTSGQIIVRAANPAALLFKQAASLELVAFDNDDGVMSIRSSGAEGWPLVDIGGGTGQAATLWVFLCIGGQWYGTGAERLRPSQVNGEKPEGHTATLIGEWLSDPRYQEMAGFNPAPGDTVAFMLVSGSTRGDDQPTVRERSNVVELVW